jgi:flagellar hook-length control protein FliK
MASDISTVKSTIATDSAIASTKGSTSKSGSGIDFADIIRNNGSRMDNGLNALSERAGISGVGERSDNPPAADDHSYDRGDDRNDNAPSHNDSDDSANHDSSRDASSQSERPNDYVNDRASDNRPETADASSGSDDSSQHTENHGENASRDERTNDTSSDDSSTVQNSDETQSVDASSDDDGEQSSVKGDNANKSGAENSGENSQNAATTSTAKQMLDSLLSNAQDTALPGQAAEQAQANTKNNTGKANASEGLDVAIANVGKQNDGAAANAAQSAANGQNTKAQTQTHNQANTQGQAQVQNTAGTEIQASAEAQAKNSSKTAEQAAQLSKMVGNGKNVEVSVSVTDEKSTLISKPTTSLASSSALAADANTPSLRSQQSQGAANANATTQAQQAAGQAAGAAGQVQQAVQQTAGGQAQSTNATAIDAKGGVQTSIHTGGSQAAVTGNGETPVAAAPNSTSAAQQAQQNTSPQAANSARFTAANTAVADQVSVQISKAINAGNDKISIQLKPADLGRVDVQMEVGHDGRVTAVVTADNKSTLDLLQKDSKELQQALQQAGLQADGDSLSFNLREQGDGKEMAGSSGNGRQEGTGESGEADLTLEEELAGLNRDVITDSRIDVRA